MRPLYTRQVGRKSTNIAEKGEFKKAKLSKESTNVQKSPGDNTRNSQLGSKTLSQPQADKSVNYNLKIQIFEGNNEQGDSQMSNY